MDPYRKLQTFVFILSCLVCGCAATVPGGIPSELPSGKGEIMLLTGGVEKLRFKVEDESTGTIINFSGLSAQVNPGRYKLVVETDLSDAITLSGIEVGEGQIVPVQVPVGRIIISVMEGNKRVRLPYLIYDANMSRVLKKGFSASTAFLLVAPVGDYKVRIMRRNALGEIEDRIEHVKVRFGRTFPVQFLFKAGEQPPGTE